MMKNILIYFLCLLGLACKSTNETIISSPPPKHITIALSDDWENWDITVLKSQAKEKNIDAILKLAELKERSCGGKIVDAYCESALKIDPDHPRANLYYGIRLYNKGENYWQFEGNNPLPYLKKALELLPGNSSNYLLTRNIIKWIEKK